MTNSTKRRVAITGLGVVSCCGIGKVAFFDGICGPAPTGEHRVSDFDPLAYFDTKEARRTDRFAQFSVAAAAEAIEDAGNLDVDPARAAVIFGSGVGGLETLQAQIAVLLEKGPRRVSPFLVPMMMANAGAAAISMRWGYQGPCESIVTACASGAQSIGAALRLIQSGRCDAAITGGAEAAMSLVGETPSIGVTAFSNMTALSTSGISRPYDVRRDGFVIAEGGAALVIEEMDHARARGAHIYAELLGAASSADAYHITAPSPEGAGAAGCMELALEDAGIGAGDIAHINGHGTSTPLNDLAEAQAIEKLFGTNGPPLTSIKGVTGHSLGAAGAIEAVAVAMSIEKALIPPTVGLEEIDPAIHVPIVTGAAQSFVPGPVLSNSFGFGGHNACLVLGPADDYETGPLSQASVAEFAFGGDLGLPA